MAFMLKSAYSKYIFLCCCLISLPQTSAFSQEINVSEDIPYNADEIISGDLLAGLTGSTYTFSTGLDYSRGKYGLPVDTRIHYVPFSIKYDNGPWTFSASTGYIQVNSPANVFIGADGIPVVNPEYPTNSETVQIVSHTKDKGLSDVYVSATYSINSLYDNNVYIDFTGRVKIPTANRSNGLGTGKTDFTIQIDISKPLGNFVPFASIGHRFLGNSDELELNNSLFFSVGTAYYLTYDTSIGMSYDFRQTATPRFKNPQEIFTYVDIQLDEKWGVNLYSVYGLNNASAKFGLGFQIRFKY